jgi:hypothetical protein
MMLKRVYTHILMKPVLYDVKCKNNTGVLHTLAFLCGLWLPRDTARQGSGFN